MPQGEKVWFGVKFSIYYSIPVVVMKELVMLRERYIVDALTPVVNKRNLLYAY